MARRRKGMGRKGRGGKGGIITQMHDPMGHKGMGRKRRGRKSR